MRQSVRLLGQSRAFTETLRKTLEDCGVRTRVEKGAWDVPELRRSPAIVIFEVRGRRDWSKLSQIKSVKPFLIYTATDPPPERLAALKEKGLVGVLRRETPPEGLAFLLNKAVFYKSAVRRNQRVLVKIPVTLRADNRTLTTFATNLSKDGIFVVTLDPLPVDAECALEFKLPGKGRALTTAGKVLYNLSINPDLNIIANPQDPFKRLVTHPGMAILFTSLPDEDRDRIDQYISTRAL